MNYSINDQATGTQRKSFEGTYIGVLMFVGDYWSHYEKTTPQESYTRAILHKPCGRVQLLQSMFKVLMQNTSAVSIIFTRNTWILYNLIIPVLIFG